MPPKKTTTTAATKAAGSKRPRTSVNPSDVVQCMGTTTKGIQCGVTNGTEAASADPLRNGEKYCTFHIAQNAKGSSTSGAVQCEGNTAKGTRCGVTSALDTKPAEPLRKGEKYCTFHKAQATEGATTAKPKGKEALGNIVQCEGKSGKGVRCKMTNVNENEAADPLRKGATFCTHHDPAAATKKSPSSGVVACKGTTAKGTPCGVTSTTQVKAADPLRAGKAFCASHKSQEKTASK